MSRFEKNRVRSKSDLTLLLFNLCLPSQITSTAVRSPKSPLYGTDLSDHIGVTGKAGSFEGTLLRRFLFRHLRVGILRELRGTLPISGFVPNVPILTKSTAVPIVIEPIQKVIGSHRFVGFRADWLP